MPIHKLPRYLKGYVTFEVKGIGREEFLNFCSKNDINLFDLRLFDDTLIVSCFVSDYRKTKAAKVAGLRKRIVKRKGIRFFTNRYKKRLGLIVGFALMIFMLIFLSGYIWDIDITGNERLSDNLILETLEECGFSEGGRKSSLDISKIENEMMIKLSDLGRISINLDGSFAHIIVKERATPPVSEDTSRPSNLVASMDGIVVKMEIVKGKPIAIEGSGVVKGQLLVTGFYNDKKDNIILEHSSGKITALAEVSKTFEISMSVEEKVGSEEKIFYSVEAFGNKLDFSFGKDVDETDWNKSVSRERMSLFGLDFPIYLIKESYTKEITLEKTLSEDEAKERIKDEIEHFEKSELYEAQIQKKHITWKSDGERCRAQVDYTFLTDIAEQQYIETEQK
ncbi:MAG: sporulation protein YqfD [Oscillospiraceae bacterium]|nr:sporulation protein YqfD [Oscillospiraceae bacterium]